MDNEIEDLLLLNADEVAVLFGLTKMSLLNRYHRDPKSLPPAVKIRGYPPRWRKKDIDEFLTRFVTEKGEQS